MGRPRSKHQSPALVESDGKNLELFFDRWTRDGDSRRILLFSGEERKVIYLYTTLFRWILHDRRCYPLSILMLS